MINKRTKPYTPNHPGGESLRHRPKTPVLYSGNLKRMYEVQEVDSLGREIVVYKSVKEIIKPITLTRRAEDALRKFGGSILTAMEAGRSFNSAVKALGEIKLPTPLQCRCVSTPIPETLQSYYENPEGLVFGTSSRKGE